LRLFDLVGRCSLGATLGRSLLYPTLRKLPGSCYWNGMGGRASGGNGRFGLSSYSGVDRPCAEDDVSSPSYLVTPNRAEVAGLCDNI
jgi:hypothetical protein